MVQLIQIFKKPFQLGNSYVDQLRMVAVIPNLDGFGIMRIRLSEDPHVLNLWARLSWGGRVGVWKPLITQDTYQIIVITTDSLNSSFSVHSSFVGFPLIEHREKREKRYFVCATVCSGGANRVVPPKCRVPQICQQKLNLSNPPLVVLPYAPLWGYIDCPAPR